MLDLANLERLLSYALLHSNMVTVTTSSEPVCITPISLTLELSALKCVRKIYPGKNYTLNKKVFVNVYALGRTYKCYQPVDHIIKMCGRKNYTILFIENVFVNVCGLLLLIYPLGCARFKNV